MHTNIAREVAALKRMTATALRARYLEVYGEPARSGNKNYLWRIIWWVQSLAEGDMSERARHRAEELANPVTIRVQHPGFHGCDLMDSKGAFGPADHLLASYQFTVLPSDPARH